VLYFLTVVNVISIKDCTFTWNDFGDENPTLKDISVDVKKGELVAVVGVVGAGKSSLLSALLGDMTKLSGQASVNVCLNPVIRIYSLFKFYFRNSLRESLSWFSFEL